ncbi:MAG: AMIN domain-containing protein, partial [Microcoleus sp. SIO2G3]|nr:AMIN domain-containing protein [Microcoleus sp. SIO2G3]
MKRFELSETLAVLGAFTVVISCSLGQAARAESVIVRSNEMDRPATTLEEWRTQLAQVELVEITNVRLNPTAGGIEVILETTGESLSSPVTSIVGNAAIADLSNAVLVGDEFEAVSPVEGIALVSVTNLPNNRVRLSVTGSDAPPVAELRTVPEGLVVSIVPEVATDQTEEEIIEIVVTAERTPEDPQDVPISLTVLTEADIEDANITSIDDIAGSVPNFTFFSGDNAVSPVYS